MPPITTVAQTPTEQTTDEATVTARDAARQRRLAAASQNTTNVTGIGATGTASTGLKTAFGA